MKIGILKTDAVRDEWVAEYGEYPDMFAKLLSDADDSLTFVTYDVRLGEYPQAIDELDAYLITGSRHSVYDDLPWIPVLLEFIAQLHAQKKKMVGICFGHQAIAQALGGSTQKAAAGWGVGLHRHRFAERQDWTDDGDLEFSILVSHQDQVIENATDATTLAGSDFCPNAVCQLGEHVLTMQGHPEFITGYSREIIELRREMIGEDVYVAGLTSLAEPPETSRMARWIVNFLRR